MEMRNAHCLVLVVFLILFTGSAGAGALRCDGVDDYATIPDTMGDLDPGQSVTVEAWVRLDAYTDLGAAVSGFPGVLSLGQGDSATAGKPSMTISIPSTESAFGPNDLPLGTWVHLAGTFDGSDIRVYVNGSLAATQSHPGTATNVSEGRLCIFAAGTSNLMDGDIDEVRWWNIVRSGTDIAADYQLVLAGNEPGLVGYWRFEETSGQTLIDSSVNGGNDGFLGSAAIAGSDDPARITDGAPVRLPPVLVPELEAQPVPALSWQGLVVLMLTLGGLGLILMRRRQSA